jgi:threonine dehydrogenase-like Zn-dependent dehydrogenase
VATPCDARSSHLTALAGQDATAVVIGCGPVGLCAVTAAKYFFKNVFAIDSVPERLEQARKHGATALHLHDDDTIGALKKATDGRGADVALEVVGVEAALHLGMQIVRPWGVVSSCGIHTHDVNMKGLDLYNKVRFARCCRRRTRADGSVCQNLRFQFGRCPVRALFPEALKLLVQNAQL